MSEQPEDIEEEQEEEEEQQQEETSSKTAYSCADCGGIFPTIEELDHHEKTVH